MAPNLADHIAPQFEDWCRQWTRSSYAAAGSAVGSWWGNALNELRRSGQRCTEQVDIVAMSRNRVTVVGEVRWRATKTDTNLLTDLETYKIPAMRQAGLRFTPNYTTLIISKGGHTPSLTRAARDSAGRVVLLNVADILTRGTSTMT